MLIFFKREDATCILSCIVMDHNCLFFFFTHTWADTVTPEEQKEMCNWLLHEALIMRMKSTQPQCK